MVRLGIFSYRCQITLTPYLNSSFVITLNFLTTFKLLIFTLFNFSQSISTLLAKKVSRIWKVIEKQDAIVAMILDQLYNISIFVIDFSPSFLLLDGVKFKDGLGLKLKVINSNQLNDGVHDGVLGIGTNKTPSFQTPSMYITIIQSHIHSHTHPHYQKT